MSKHTAQNSWWRRPIVLAGAAFVAAIVLIGGPVTFAFLSDTTAQPTKTITAGGLTLNITTATEWVSTTSPSNIVASGTTGFVPGARGQKVTYTLTNAAASATPATLAGTISAPAFWADLSAKGLLTVTPSVVSGTCSTGAVAVSATAVSVPVQSTTKLAPGASCTISVTVAIAASSASTDGATYLRASRNTTPAGFTIDATLTQAPR